MNKQTLLKSLIEFGLTDKEAEVYLASLSLGQTTILQIARNSGIKRTTVYSLVESLKQKGLMGMVQQGFKQYYVAENPERLEVMIEEKRSKLSKTLPDLQSLYSVTGDSDLIRYYEGVSGIHAVYDSVLKDMRPKDEYMVVANVDDWFKTDEKYMYDFTMKRAEFARIHNVNIRILLEDGPRALEYKKKEKLYHAKVKILPKNIKLTADLIVLPRRVMLHQLKPPRVMVIENQSVIKMQQDMFEMVWAATK